MTDMSTFQEFTNKELASFSLEHINLIEDYAIDLCKRAGKIREYKEMMEARE